MVCIFHDWQDVSTHLTRFEEYATVKECTKCDKLSIDIDNKAVEEQRRLDIVTEAKVVITMADMASPSCDNYPNEYDLEVSLKMMKKL